MKTIFVDFLQSFKALECSAELGGEDLLAVLDVGTFEVIERLFLRQGGNGGRGGALGDLQAFKRFDTLLGAVELPLLGSFGGSLSGNVGKVGVSASVVQELCELLGG